MELEILVAIIIIINCDKVKSSIDSRRKWMGKIPDTFLCLVEI